MTTMPRIWPGFFAVWAAIVLHWLWAGTLLANSAAGDSTPVNTVVRMVGGSAYAAAGLFVLVSLLALYGMHSGGIVSKIGLIFPQQVVLGVSAAGAVIAAIDGHYADGVARPVPFIMADQAAIILTWFFHTCALVFLYLVYRRIINMDGSPGEAHPDRIPRP